LEPETNESLKAAQKAVEEGGFLPRYSLRPNPSLGDAMESFSNQWEKIDNAEPEKLFISKTGDTEPRNIEYDFQVSSNAFHATQSFIMLPSKENLITSLPTEREISSSASKYVTPDTEQKSLKS
jgi:hypothetical protein